MATEVEIEELLKSLDYSGEGNGYPNTLCLRAASTLRKLLDEGEHGWVIETASGEYWNGREVGESPRGAFVRDHNEALRFARQEDAEIVRSWLFGQPGRGIGWSLRATQHKWIAATSVRANANQTGDEK